MAKKKTLDPKIDLVNNHLTNKGINISDWEQEAFNKGLIEYLKPIGVTITSSFAKEIIEKEKYKLAEEIMIQQMENFSKKEKLSHENSNDYSIKIENN